VDLTVVPDPGNAGVGKTDKKAVPLPGGFFVW